MKFSLLDLCPICEGKTARDALTESLTLAQLAEREGYTRYWVAEHHNMPGIASAATSVVIAHLAQGTTSIRVGAGGIMLPNHAPLQVAEQFGTLESLYPGRIDLGLGRAPGTDGATARALRRSLHSDEGQFPQDVVELLHYFISANEAVALSANNLMMSAAAGRGRVTAVPGQGLQVPVWILGSSLFGAQLAAKLGLPYAFASHFAPAQLQAALASYRQHFQPSAYLDQPYAMAVYNVFAADTQAEADTMVSSVQQSFVNLQSGDPQPLAPPVEGYLQSLPVANQQLLQQAMRYSTVGDADLLARDLAAFIETTQVDEIMLSAMIFDNSAKHQSFRIAADVMRALA